MATIPALRREERRVLRSLPYWLSLLRMS